jgi:5'-deoxynucleotidase YfbR-like HD superfamily hydrolase
MSNYIETWNGVHFHFEDSNPEEVNIEDIAHALSLQCRFNGHVDRFYSVAEHCVLMSHLVPEELAFAALLHDAGEAYVGDMAHPIKMSKFGSSFEKLEEVVLRAICTKFNIPYADTQRDDLKLMDRRLCASEAQELFKSVPGWTAKYKAAELKPEGWTPKQAEKYYLRRFKELTND